MAAYAALNSLLQILDQLQRHPFPPISLDREQVDSLTEIATYLQKFLEGYDSPFVDSDETDPLEMRIADAAYVAEDVIESYIADNIHFAAHDEETDNQKKKICRFFNCFRGSKKPKNGGRKNKNDELNSKEEINSNDDEDASSGHGEAINSGEEISRVNFYQDLWKVIEEMDLVKKEAMEKTAVQAHHQLQRNTFRSSSLSGKNSGVMEMMRGRTDVQAHHQLQRNILRSPSLSGKNSSVMVGFDDVLLQLLDKLTGESSSLQVIPITGWAE